MPLIDFGKAHTIDYAGDARIPVDAANSDDARTSGIRREAVIAVIKNHRIADAMRIAFIGCAAIDDAHSATGNR